MQVIDLGTKDQIQARLDIMDHLLIEWDEAVDNNHKEPYVILFNVMLEQIKDLLAKDLGKVVVTTYNEAWKKEALDRDIVFQKPSFYEKKLQ